MQKIDIYNATWAELQDQILDLRRVIMDIDMALIDLQKRGDPYDFIEDLREKIQESMKNF